MPQGCADAWLAVPALVAAELPRLRRANPGTGLFLIAHFRSLQALSRRVVHSDG